MGRIFIYMLCLMAVGFTACEKEPINQDQGLSAALGWADDTDRGTEIKDACVWIFDAEGKQVVKQRYDSKQGVALDIHPLAAGEYHVVTATNLSTLFIVDKEATFNDFTIKSSDAKANPKHAHYSVATIKAEQGRNIRTPLPLRRILSELTVEVDGAPKGSTLEASVSNAADGIMPARKDVDNSWGKATNSKLNVVLPEAQEQSGRLIIPTMRLMPTVGNMSFSYLSLLFHLSDGTLRKCDVEAPVMKSAGKYHLKLKYSELKPFLHVEPIQIADWVESWTVNGEVLNPNK